MVPPEIKETLEKISNPSNASSSFIQSDPNKYSQTIVQGRYTFYNPNPQQSIEERKTVNDPPKNKSSLNGFNNYKNYDAMNKNNYSSNYIKERNSFDNTFIYTKIVNRVDNNENAKMNQTNILNKIPLKKHEVLNYNKEKINNLSTINQNNFINNDNFKHSNQQDEYKKINEHSSGEMINNRSFNPLSKIRTMNIKEVKEFVPKNFVIINKGSKN